MQTSSCRISTPPRSSASHQVLLCPRLASPRSGRGLSAEPAAAASPRPLLFLTSRLLRLATAQVRYRANDKLIRPCGTSAHALTCLRLLPACDARAGICESEPGASAACSHLVARSSCHLRSLCYLTTVSAAHRIVGRARVASPACCPTLSRRARRRCLRLTGERCAVRRSQDTTVLLATWATFSLMGSACRDVVRHRLARRLAHRYALPLRTRWLLWATRPLQAPPQRCARRARPRLPAARQGVMSSSRSARRRSARPRMR